MKLNFQQTLKHHNLDLIRKKVEILQVNMGKKCNLTCTHCHVEAGPHRTENMEEETVDQLIRLIEASEDVHTVDLTGGAPELNPNFRKLVEAAFNNGKKVIDRCNLTVLFEPGQEDTVDFFKRHQVNVVASLPCYSRENVERQRGDGVFNKSIEAMRWLNDVGYGAEGSSLVLDLVYNPNGAFLPPDQEKLQQDYKSELKELFNISFNNLFTITNMPIKRFNNYLKREGKLEEYQQLLRDNFNPCAAAGVMCTNLLSIGYDGEVYDCDFNQMLELPLARVKKSIFDYQNLDDLQGSPIVFKDHCFGCSAGAGSSCGGATIQ